MALQPGSTFAGYVIERRIGVGGMGAVYLAKHPRLPRRDALKILDAGLGADQGFRARFEREAELTSRLDHPNIVTIHDRGLEGDQLWISMRYVDGVDAAQLIAQYPTGLPVERALTITTEAAKGLDYAHRHGLLHRDVKPANLLIATDDDGDHVYVTDFGIARTLDDSTVLTSTGSFLATIAYAAPELIEGKPIDHRIDVYALGCTFFEMLTGSVPFDRPNPVAVMHAHLSAAPPAASTRNPAVPRALDAVIARAMAKNPAERFQTCREFIAAARAALTHPSAPTQQRQIPQPAPPTVVRPTPPPSFATAPRPAQPTPPPQPFPPQQTYQPQPYTPQYQPRQQSGPARQFASTPPPRKKVGTGAIIAGVMALLLAFVIVVVAVLVSNNKGGTKSGGSNTPATEEEAVEAAIRDTYASIVSDGIEGALPRFCESSQTILQVAIDAGGFDTFVVGEFDISVDSVDDIYVDGDSASATSTTTTTGLGSDFDGTETTSENLVKEDGEWKLCWDI